MKHRVSPRATIKYDSEERTWIATVEHEDATITLRSVELTQVVFQLADMDEIEPQSYQWANNDGIEQVLVVLPEETEER